MKVERCLLLEKEFFDKLELRLSGTIPLSCKVVSDEFNFRCNEVTLR